MADQHNSVTLFSNGQAHVRQYRKVEKGKTNEFSLPFRKTSMEDVLASFGVYNSRVRYVRPASFQLPDKKSTLTLGNSTYETLASLRGAKVKCKRANSEVEGTIFNTDTLQEVGQNGQVVHTPYLTIQTKDGLETLPWREITKLVFTEDEIKGEIEKALAANRQKLKPDAVFLNVALATKSDDPQNDQDELALLQWVEQLVPWTLAYRLSCKEDGKSYVFDIFGVAYNPTDTDWTDTIICLVNGKPMTFISDLDQPRQVQRQHVNITDAIAKGGMIPEHGFADDAGDYEAEALERSEFMAAKSPDSDVAPQAARFRKVGAKGMGRKMIQSQASFPAQVATEDVGDYCVYKQEYPMNIAANSAATIPLFSTDVKASERVLIYDERHSLTHPFRAINFKNETTQGLGMGVCVIFERGLFQGKCVMQASKPGESRMLYYAEETGVHVTNKPHTTPSLPRRLKVHEGTVISTTVQKSRTTYTLRNVKDEAFDVLVEYQKRISPEAKLSVECHGVKQAEELKAGVRYAVKLAAKATVTFTVYEEYTGTDTVEINDADWFLDTYLTTDRNLTADKQIAAIIKQAETVAMEEAGVQMAQRAIDKAMRTKSDLTDILQLGNNAGNVEQYQADLQTVMKTLKEQADTMEKADQKKHNARKKLEEMLQKLSGEWAYSDSDGKGEDNEPPEEVVGAGEGKK